MKLADWLMKESLALALQIDMGFIFKLEGGQQIRTVACIQNFGASNGMLICTSDEVLRHSEEVERAGYGFSIMSDGDGYEDDLGSIKELLADWGWTGDPEHKPSWAMTPVPVTIDGAKVICYAHIGSLHPPTGKVNHVVEGKMAESADALAICQYDNSKDYYLFGCDVNWQAVTDTCHGSIEAAKQQADLEYEDIDGAWIEC